jgi:hypothetical protein
METTAGLNARPTEMRLLAYCQAYHHTVPMTVRRRRIPTRSGVMAGPLLKLPAISGYRTAAGILEHRIS